MPDYRAMTRDSAQRAGIDPALFERQINQESAYNLDVIECRRESSAGAQGIAQIIRRWHPNVDPCDPPAALDYAARLMAGYVKRYSSYRKALVAYNWGSGNLEGYTKQDGTRVPPWDGQRATLPGETQHYLDVILGAGWPEPGMIMPIDNGTTIRAKVIELAKKEIGKRYAGPVIGEPDSYRWGDPGWDCSSFVSAMYDRATGGKVKLTAFTNAAHNQSDWVREPQPGDIVFYHYRDSQGIEWPHMGLWLSSTEVLDARHPQGVGIHPHVTPIGPDAQGRYRKTMRPKGLANVAPPPPPPGDPLLARIAQLERELADARNLVGNAYSPAGVVRKALQTLVDASADELAVRAMRQEIDAVIGFLKANAPAA